MGVFLKASQPFATTVDYKGFNKANFSTNLLIQYNAFP